MYGIKVFSGYNRLFTHVFYYDSTVLDLKRYIASRHRECSQKWALIFNGRPIPECGPNVKLSSLGFVEEQLNIVNLMIEIEPCNDLVDKYRAQCREMYEAQFYAWMRPFLFISGDRWMATDTDSSSLDSYSSEQEYGSEEDYFFMYSTMSESDFSLPDSRSGGNDEEDNSGDDFSPSFYYADSQGNFERLQRYLAAHNIENLNDWPYYRRQAPTRRIADLEPRSASLEPSAYHYNQRRPRTAQAPYVVIDLDSDS